MVRVPSLTGDTTASYRISLIRTGEGSDASWVAEVNDLPDSAVRGASPAEAVARASAAIESALANGSSPAEPETAPRHSGKLLVRMPATLHDELARAAEAEGVSLNQLITGALASAVDWRSTGERAPVAGPGTSEAPGRLAAGLMRYALIANLAVLLLATTVAIALLVVAWRAGL